MHMRVYKTTTVNAGGVPVEVRQVLFFGSSTVPEQVAAVVVAAREWLNRAIHQLISNISPLTRDCFRFCFLTDLTPQLTNELHWKLTAIQEGLSNPLGIKVRDLGPDVGGHVRVDESFPVFEDGEVRYPYKNPVGEIHLDRKLLLHPNKATWTLIHEAGHKFAKLEDIAYADGYYDFVVVQRRQFDPHTLYAGNAMRNADCYAMFVCLLAHPEIARAVLPKGGQRAA